MPGAPLAARLAIVTGGAGALGQAVTRRLLADGATTWVPYVVEEEHARLRARVAGKTRDRLFTAAVDVVETDAMAGFVETVCARHGRIDILVAAVGGFAAGALLDTDRPTWDRMLALNLTSAFSAARAVAPHMVAGGHGRIVTVASRAVVPPAAGFIAYTVAKAGVIALTQALAQEMRGHGVTVNAVLPSTMDTPANRAAMPDVDPASWVSVEAVADAIAFLVRDESAHVTGALLTI
jgi:NAD(P)-dependent dehydrogenase (short-subunit alcohol dehydrogenase family)